LLTATSAAGTFLFQEIQRLQERIEKEAETRIQAREDDSEGENEEGMLAEMLELRRKVETLEMEKTIGQQQVETDSTLIDEMMASEEHSNRQLKELQARFGELRHSDSPLPRESTTAVGATAVIGIKPLLAAGDFEQIPAANAEMSRLELQVRVLKEQLAVERQSHLEEGPGAQLEALKEELDELREDMMVEAEQGSLGGEMAVEEGRLLGYLVGELRSLSASLLAASKSWDSKALPEQANPLDDMGVIATAEMDMILVRQVTAWLIEATAGHQEWGRQGRLTLQHQADEAASRVVQLTLESQKIQTELQGHLDVARGENHRMERELRAAREREREQLTRLQEVETRLLLTEGQAASNMELVRAERKAASHDVGAMKTMAHEAKEERLHLYQAGREQQEILMRQVEELQNVCTVLKRDKEESYREMRRDKEVLERIVTDVVRSIGNHGEPAAQDGLELFKSATGGATVARDVY